MRQSVRQQALKRDEFAYAREPGVLQAQTFVQSVFRSAEWLERHMQATRTYWRMPGAWRRAALHVPGSTLGLVEGTWQGSFMLDRLVVADPLGTERLALVMYSRLERPDSLLTLRKRLDQQDLHLGLLIQPGDGQDHAALTWSRYRVEFLSWHESLGDAYSVARLLHVSSALAAP